MGEYGDVYRGRTWTLRRAIDLMRKDSLSIAELSMLVDGGAVCTEQGVELLSEGRKRGDMVKVLDALLATSDAIVKKIQAALTQPGISRNTDEYRRLTLKAGMIREKAGHIAHWAAHYSNRPEHDGFHA